MKKKEINAALNALQGIKMPKIENKELRKVLIENHFVLLGASKAYEERTKDLESVHLGAYKDERILVGNLQNELQAEKDSARIKDLIGEINSHKDLFAAVQTFNEAVAELGNEDVEGLKPVDRGKFMDALGDQDYTLAIVADLYPLFIL